MRNTLLITLLLAVNSIIYSQQNQLSGVVTNQNTGEAVFSANVYLPQLEKGTMTDLDGNFSINNIPDGNYKLIISSIGFATLNLDVKIPSEAMQIQLNPSAIEMEEVIISTPFHQLQSENVMKVERESVSELNKKGAINLSDGITQIAGVESLTTGVGIGKPVIRGLSSNRVLVYTQGVRLENQQYGDEHGLGISSKGIGSVEVIKGPASLLYGSDAIGGVLYLNPERYASAGETNVELESDYFSNTIGYQTSLMAKTSSEKLKFLARGSYAAHSDYEDGDDVRITNTRFNEKDLKAGIGFQDKNYKADLRYNFNRSEIGIPEEIGIQSKDKEPLLPFQKIDNHVLSLDNRFYFNNSSIDFKIGYQYNDRKEFEEHHHHEEEEHEEHEEEEHEEHEEHEEEAATEPALEMHLETLNYNLKYNLPKIGNFETIAGVQGMYQTNSNFGEEILIPDAETLDFGVFVTTHYHLESWDFQGGLRFDNRSLETDQFEKEDGDIINAVDRDFNSINAALGAKYQFDQKFIARLNLASGFRAPNLSELTSNGNHNGANRYEIGNPDLTNEQNFQIDLALEWRNEHFEAFVNAFNNSVNDYIFISPTGETLEEEPVFRYEQANANLYGGEIGVHIHPHPLDWLHLESSFETVTGKLNDDTYLPLIPANSLTNTLRIEFESGNSFKDSYTFLRLKNVFDQDNPSQFETATSGYPLLGAGVGTSLELSTVQLDLNLSGSNLLNKQYISHLSRLKPDGINNIGRNIVLSAKLSI
ncbi:TonB-dependent receptor [Christiangramia sp. SM2212]|uniref:TonB-dependent receptor n=1 Tax=Christiangramia sediminicola TaxID=3073267 RepID=A0ABU1EPN5_9FLAO|nr:TonB-dependent receptor [Christiangramia sp. SM2212]MDR5590123.1 TonB-dependent receptor [Christiangramia sp. SM2212]